MKSGQHLLESRHRAVRRTVIGGAGKGVEGDQVHLRSEWCQKPSQLTGLERAVVDPGQKNVFKGDPVPVPERESAAGRKDLLDGVDPSHRHDFPPKRIVRGTQADGQTDTRIGLAQGVNAGNQSRGRDRDAARRESGAIGMGQGADGRNQGLKVGQWFAHSHEDDVVDVGLSGRECLDKSCGQKPL